MNISIKRHRIGGFTIIFKTEVGELEIDGVSGYLNVNGKIEAESKLAIEFYKLAKGCLNTYGSDDVFNKYVLEDLKAISEENAEELRLEILNLREMLSERED